MTSSLIHAIIRIEKVRLKMTKTKKELYAYLAGLIDGEGTICISKSRKPPKTFRNPLYCETVSIRMVNPLALKLCYEIFGGSFLRDTDSRCQWGKSFTTNKLFSWRASHKKIEKVLTKLLPYLIIKKRRAEIVLEMRQVKKSTKGLAKRWFKREGITAKYEELYQRCRACRDNKEFMDVRIEDILKENEG